MLIRTGGDYAHRKSTIDAAASLYDCNKTKAMLLTADDVDPLLVCLGRTWLVVV